ncbi:hypothetical protein DUI87_00757 [Hirundo rustica rustica]|uniref:Uncharacterized protein n=1 Tax=Hirundo rustica rustica TaxID=333673 RepID=A0A3M0LB12_HIRRU|nr:hypothetical protein DUI87_00757 [Hirundo rustica rustica]
MEPNSEYFVTGDTAHTPLEVEVAPMTIKGKITGLMLLAHCMHPPFYLTEGQVLAQAIPIPAEVLADGKSPEVYWAEVVGENKPSLACNLARGSDCLHVEGVLDSGADVTVIPESMWPSHWELQPVAGKLQGIGGITMAKISKNIVQIEGPDGKLANKDKVQRMPPWKYLGLQIAARTIVLQKLEIECNPKTLADLHSLCESLHWAKLSHHQYHQNVPGLIRQFRLTRSQARAIVATCPNCQVQEMPLMEKAYLTFNPVMNPIQVVILLLLNSLATAWIIPQPCQNVWVTLAQTLPQENICLSTASTENPMSTCLVGIPLWAGILSRLLGGPCTIGRLSVLTPNQTLIGEWTHKNKSANKIQKRSADQLDPNCDSEIFHWAKSKRVAVSLFLPWVAAAKAPGELGHLECWVVKQANLTSTAISSLLEDEEITRQATLQNCAAIDYLLLLHGHECQEFEGLCCLNLTSKAPNIHAALRSMNSLIGQVKQESEDWIKELCKGWGLTEWWTSIVKTILLFLVILFLVTIAFGILRCLIFKAISSLIPSTSEVNHIGLANLKQVGSPTNCNWWENPHSV